MGVINLAVLAYILRTTTKRSSTLFEKKSAFPVQNLATPMNVETSFTRTTSKSVKLKFN